MGSAENFVGICKVSSCRKADSGSQLVSVFRTKQVGTQRFRCGGLFSSMCCASCILRYEFIAHEIQDRAGFDPSNVSPISHAPHIECPVLFISCSEDTHVLPHHCQDLYDAWGGGSKRILPIPGDHWDYRPTWMCMEASDFLEEELLHKHWHADLKELEAG